MNIGYGQDNGKDKSSIVLFTNIGLNGGLSDASYNEWRNNSQINYYSESQSQSKQPQVESYLNGHQGGY